MRVFFSCLILLTRKKNPLKKTLFWSQEILFFRESYSYRRSFEFTMSNARRSLRLLRSMPDSTPNQLDNHELVHASRTRSALNALTRGVRVFAEAPEQQPVEDEGIPPPSDSAVLDLSSDGHEEGGSPTESSEPRDLGEHQGADNSTGETQGRGDSPAHRPVDEETVQDETAEVLRLRVRVSDDTYPYWYWCDKYNESLDLCLYGPKDIPILILVKR